MLLSINFIAILCSTFVEQHPAMHCKVLRDSEIPLHIKHTPLY